MNLSKVDLNLLVYFSVLLREGNVTKAAEHLGLSQPAMSNCLRRLRKVFNDPLLVRTSNGMMPTDKAQELQPLVQNVLSQIELFMQPTIDFAPANSKRLFRVMASDYAETTLLPKVRTRMAEEAPETSLDILTPSDVTFQDIEVGNVDLIKCHNHYIYLCYGAIIFLALCVQITRLEKGLILKNTFKQIMFGLIKQVWGWQQA